MQLVTVAGTAAKTAATYVAKAALIPQEVKDIQFAISAGSAVNKFLLQPARTACNSWFTTCATGNSQHIDPGVNVGQQIDQAIQQNQVSETKELTNPASRQFFNICQMTNNVVLALELAKNQPIVQQLLQKCVASASFDLAYKVDPLPSQLITFEEAYSVYKFRPALWQAWEAAASKTISCENIPVVESALNDLNFGVLQKNSDIVAAAISKLNKIYPHFECKPYESNALSTGLPAELSLPPQSVQPKAQESNNAPDAVNRRISFSTHGNNSVSGTITGDDIRRAACLDAYYADRWHKPTDSPFGPDGLTIGSTQNWRMGIGVSAKYEGTLSELQKPKPKSPDQFVDHIAHNIYHLGKKFDTSPSQLPQIRQELANARWELQTYKNMSAKYGNMSGETQAQSLIDCLDLLLGQISEIESNSFSTTLSPVVLDKSDLKPQVQADLYRDKVRAEGSAAQKEAQANDWQRELQSYIGKKVDYDQSHFWQRFNSEDPAAIQLRIENDENKLKECQQSVVHYQQQAQIAAQKIDAIRQQQISDCGKQGVAELLQQLKELYTMNLDRYIEANSYLWQVISERRQIIKDELQKRYFSPEQQQTLNTLVTQPINKESSVPRAIQQARIDALQQTIANKGALKQWTYACDHELSEYLKKLDIDPATLNYFESNVIQEQLIKENLQILNNSAENQSCLESRSYLDCAALTATNAIDHIQAGNYVEAHALTDLSYALQDFAHGVAEQAAHATVEGLKAYGNLFFHPIESSKNIAKGIGQVLGIMLKEAAYVQFTKCGTDSSQLTGWAAQYKQEREALTNALANELQNTFKDGTFRGCGRLAGQVIADVFIAPRFIGILNKFTVNPLTRKTLNLLGKVATKTSEEIKPLLLAGNLSINIARATPEQLTDACHCFKKEFDQYTAYAEKVAGKPIPKEELLQAMGGVNQAVGEGIQAFDAAVERAVNKGQALNQKTADKVIKKIPHYIQTQRLRIEKLEKYLDTELAKIKDPIFTKAKLKHMFGIDKLLKEYKSGKLGDAKYSGYHHDHGWKLVKEGKVKFLTEPVVYPNGVVYVEKVCVEGVVLKEAKTFFPSEWLRQQVIDKILEASQNIIGNVSERVCDGITSEGLKIRLVIDADKTLITAFPLVK